MKKLTVGMATYLEPGNAWFTLQALRRYHGDWFDIVVVDNAPESSHTTKSATLACGGRYFHRPDLTGTSRPRDAVFRYADTEWVVCCDSHILFEKDALEFFRDGRAENHLQDIVSGPMVADDGKGLSSHWKPKGIGMWGTWNYDDRARVSTNDPFEIPMQGLGVFAMQKEHWPGFHPMSRGFGGEEGYIHEKVRRAGGKAICVPSLRWYHLTRNKETSPPYPSKLNDHTRNLLLQHMELKIDALDEIYQEFGRKLSGQQWDSVLREAQAINARPPVTRQKVLGVWYSDNHPPRSLLQNSLKTIAAAEDWAKRHGGHEVKVIGIPWTEIGGVVQQSAFMGTRKRAHATIIEQIQQGLGWGDANAFKPDVVCLLEHDVLYPPDYFVTVADVFANYPTASVVSNLDYIGLSADGWQTIKERHEPLHQLSMRAAVLDANLERAATDCKRQGWCHLEPPGDHSDWIRIQASSGLGMMPSVHVNHTHGRFTAHGDVCYHPASTENHPHWGKSSHWWVA